MLEPTDDEPAPDQSPDIAVVFVDFNRFKAVNDEFGHAVGDSLLAEVGARLRGVVRGADVVGRLGGDEFLLVCRNVTDGEEALKAMKVKGYAAVLIDCPPGLSDGVDSAGEFRRLLGDDPTPIVAMIAHPTAEERERSLAAGIEHQVSRPLDSAVLQATLAETVRSVPIEHHDAPLILNGPGEDDGVIDPSRLEDLAELSAGDGTSLLTSLIDSFILRAGSRVEELERAVTEGDLEAVTAVAHDLKGASGTIGAPRVMSCAAEMERRSRDGLEPSPGSLSRLRTELAAATDALTDYARHTHSH